MTDMLDTLAKLDTRHRRVYDAAIAGAAAANDAAALGEVAWLASTVHSMQRFHREGLVGFCEFVAYGDPADTVTELTTEYADELATGEVTAAELPAILNRRRLGRYAADTIKAESAAAYRELWAV